MQKLRRWTKKEKDFMKKYYPYLDNISISKRLNRTTHSLRDRAWLLGLKKVRTRQKRFCFQCGGKIGPYSKNILCRSCSSKKVYKKRGVFTNHNGKLFTEDEVKLLYKNYPSMNKKKLCKILNRNWSSIIHKALRLGIKRNREAYEISMGLFTSENNPMNNRETRIKVSKILKEKYRNGKLGIVGIAKKSMMGLTKLENHPNWKGGISFEPYNQFWNNEFKRQIKIRDNYECMICEKSEEQERKEIGQGLVIHHIDYNKKNSCLGNCITLCNSCHCKTNYKRFYWMKFFNILLEEKYGLKCIIQSKLR